MKKVTHSALYGNTKLIRSYCKRCRRMAFVLDGLIQCCDTPVYRTAKRVIRMTLATQVRKKPSKKQQDELLEQYRWSCAYCERAFGSYAKYGNEVRKIRINWDHKVPWIYNQNNHDENFLPACQCCNAWKSSKIFANIDEVRLFVHQKWMDYGEEGNSQWKSSVSQQSDLSSTEPVNDVRNDSQSGGDGNDSVPPSANGKRGRLSTPESLLEREFRRKLALKSMKVPKDEA